MYKIVMLLERKDGLTHEEFLAEWQGDHTDDVTDMPGLRKYTHCVPVDPESSPYDGITELYFDDREAAETALESSQKDDAEADAQTFLEHAPPTSTFVDEQVIYDDTD